MPGASDIFRKEALEHQSSPQHEAHLLQLSPRWTRWAYWLLVAVCVAGVGFALVAHVNEYAAGPAIVKVEGRTDLTAHAAGIVQSVDARPGQRVAPGTVLVRLNVVDEANELRRLQHEFELQLLKRLADPSDQAARAALVSLRAQRELAAARLEERMVRAPRAGIVSDVRIRAGQNLAPGDVILSLVGEEARFRVVAMLPGQYRPLVRRGMALRLELVGYPYAWQRLTVDAVGDEVVGPAEVRRYLGAEVADTVQGQGPMILVEAHLPARSFVADDGRQLDYYDGMPGRAEASVRSESLAVTLVPALKYVLGRAGRDGRP